MWFGDLVTMRWWDDLWLNEAFASWAATWAAAKATDYTDADATILATLELRGYRADMGPGTHPIRAEVADVAGAFANFDEITYEKGQAVLRQLVAYVGEERFVEGLRAYFRDHAWGNTDPRRPDARDRRGGRPGPRRLAGGLARPGRHRHDRPDARPGRRARRRAGCSRPAPTAASRGRHHLRIGSYRRTPDGDPGGPRSSWSRPPTWRRPAPPRRVDLPDADLHLLNDGDLTFAAVRTDEASLEAMLDLAPHLPDAVSRAAAVTTAWDMLAKGELSAGDFLDCVLAVLATERAPGLVEPFFSLALQAAERWSPTRARASAPGQGGRRRRPAGRRRPTTARPPSTPWPGLGDLARALRAARPRGRVQPRPGVAGAHPAGLPGQVRRGGGPGPARPRSRPGRRGPRPSP